MKAANRYIQRSGALVVPCGLILSACDGALELATDDSDQVLFRQLQANGRNRGRPKGVRCPGHFLSTTALKGQSEQERMARFLT
jgi:hypothetical protein